MGKSILNIVLASRSAVRGNLLRAAGVEFIQETSDVDETVIKSEMLNKSARPEIIARALARAKALRVAVQYPTALVIGADQLLECNGYCFDKPKNMNAAREHLSIFRGRQHRLISAVVAVRGCDVHWEHHEEAHLRMRSFSDLFLDNYIQAGGLNILESVGAYQLEGLGAQLFENIEGDYFTILGLPLLPLLSYLREEKLLIV